MVRNRIQMVHGATLQIKLCEADDAGFALVNDSHFALALNSPLNVSGALRKGVNELKLVVDNTGTAIPLAGTLPGGAWSGRFELYVAGGMVGAYAEKGHDGLGRRQHTVAEIELLVVDPPPGETGEGQSVAWWWKILGY
jgi:hypothetical protein